MSEEIKFYHNEKDVVDVLEDVFIFKDTYDKFTKLDLECIHDLLQYYKQEKEKNKELEKYKSGYELLQAGLDNYISKDKLSDIILSSAEHIAIEKIKAMLF